MLEEAIFEMDVVSTAFNKNVAKRHESRARKYQNLQRKGTATLIEGLATIPGVSQVSTGTSIGNR
jgi:iron complex outermembrane receptor protein